MEIGYQFVRIAFKRNTGEKNNQIFTLLKRFRIIMKSNIQTHSIEISRFNVQIRTNKTRKDSILLHRIESFFVRVPLQEF